MNPQQTLFLKNSFNFKRKILIIFLLFAISCHEREVKINSCSYLINELFKNNDSSKLKITKSRTKDWIDVYESVDTSEEKSLYQFDRNKKLRFYAFLIDTNYGYDFSISYDSLGNIIKKTGTEIVRWYFYKDGKDSLNVSFLLYSLQNLYGKVSMSLGSDSIKNVKLYKSVFSNLIGGKIKFKNFDLKKNSTKPIYISGLKVNTCSRDTIIFKDSVYLPHTRRSL